MQRSDADIEKAIALFRAGNPVAAAQACRAALRRDQRNVATLFVLALTQMQQGKHEKVPPELWLEFGVARSPVT
jgi:Tfp pilus assembly protein PilF